MIECVLLAASFCADYKPKPVVHHSHKLEFALHAGSLALDGWSTSRFVANHYSEQNPVSRALVGPHPSNAAITLGALGELVGTELLVRKFPKMRWLRISLTVGHTGVGVSNLRLRRRR